jgi:hypothetical protein
MDGHGEYVLFVGFVLEQALIDGISYPVRSLDKGERELLPLKKGD